MRIHEFLWRWKACQVPSSKCRRFFVFFPTWHLIEPKAQTNWWQIDAWNSALSDSLRELFLLDLTFISCIVDSCKARLSQTKWLSQSCFSQRRASRFCISLFGFVVNLILMQAIWQCWAVRTSFKVLFILSRGQVFEILDQLMVCSTSSPPNLDHVWNLPKKCEIRKLPFPFVSGQLRCTQLCSTNLALFIFEQTLQCGDSITLCRNIAGQVLGHGHSYPCCSWEAPQGTWQPSESHIPCQSPFARWRLQFTI